MTKSPPITRISTVILHRELYRYYHYDEASVDFSLVHPLVLFETIFGFVQQPHVASATHLSAESLVLLINIAKYLLSLYIHNEHAEYIIDAPKLLLLFQKQHPHTMSEFLLSCQFHQDSEVKSALISRILNLLSQSTYSSAKITLSPHQLFHYSPPQQDDFDNEEQIQFVETLCPSRSLHTTGTPPTDEFPSTRHPIHTKRTSQHDTVEEIPSLSNFDPCYPLGVDRGLPHTPLLCLPFSDGFDKSLKAALASASPSKALALGTILSQPIQAPPPHPLLHKIQYAPHPQQLRQQLLTMLASPQTRDFILSNLELCRAPSTSRIGASLKGEAQYTTRFIDFYMNMVRLSLILLSSSPSPVSSSNMTTSSNPFPHHGSYLAPNIWFPSPQELLIDHNTSIYPNYAFLALGQDVLFTHVLECPELDDHSDTEQPSIEDDATESDDKQDGRAPPHSNWFGDLLHVVFPHGTNPFSSFFGPILTELESYITTKQHISPKVNELMALVDMKSLSADELCTSVATIYHDLYMELHQVKDAFVALSHASLLTLLQPILESLFDVTTDDQQNDLLQSLTSFDQKYHPDRSGIQQALSLWFQSLISPPQRMVHAKATLTGDIGHNTVFTGSELLLHLTEKDDDIIYEYPIPDIMKRVFYSTQDPQGLSPTHGDESKTSLSHSSRVIAPLLMWVMLRLFLVPLPPFYNPLTPNLAFFHFPTVQDENKDTPHLVVHDHTKDHFIHDISSRVAMVLAAHFPSEHHPSNKVLTTLTSILSSEMYAQDYRLFTPPTLDATHDDSSDDEDPLKFLAPLREALNRFDIDTLLFLLDLSEQHQLHFGAVSELGRNTSFLDALQSHSVENTKPSNPGRGSHMHPPQFSDNKTDPRPPAVHVPMLLDAPTRIHADIYLAYHLLRFSGFSGIYQFLIMESNPTVFAGILKHYMAKMRKSHGISSRRLFRIKLTPEFIRRRYSDRNMELFEDLSQHVVISPTKFSTSKHPLLVSNSLVDNAVYDTFSLLPGHSTEMPIDAPGTDGDGPLDPTMNDGQPHGHVMANQSDENYPTHQYRPQNDIPDYKARTVQSDAFSPSSRPERPTESRANPGDSHPSLAFTRVNRDGENDNLTQLSSTEDRSSLDSSSQQKSYNYDHPLFPNTATYNRRIFGRRRRTYQSIGQRLNYNIPNHGNKSLASQEQTSSIGSGSGSMPSKGSSSSTHSLPNVTPSKNESTQQQHTTGEKRSTKAPLTLLAQLDIDLDAATANDLESDVDDDDINDDSDEDYDPESMFYYDYNDIMDILDIFDEGDEGHRTGQEYSQYSSSTLSNIAYQLTTVSKQYHASYPSIPPFLSNSFLNRLFDHPSISQSSKLVKSYSAKQPFYTVYLQLQTVFNQQLMRYAGPMSASVEQIRRSQLYHALGFHLSPDPINFHKSMLKFYTSYDFDDTDTLDPFLRLVKSNTLFYLSFQLLVLFLQFQQDYLYIRDLPNNDGTIDHNLHLVHYKENLPSPHNIPRRSVIGVTKEEMANASDDVRRDSHDDQLYEMYHTNIQLCQCPGLFCFCGVRQTIGLSRRFIDISSLSRLILQALDTIPLTSYHIDDMQTLIQNTINDLISKDQLLSQVRSLRRPSHSSRFGALSDDPLLVNFQFLFRMLHHIFHFRHYAYVNGILSSQSDIFHFFMLLTNVIRDLSLVNDTMLSSSLFETAMLLPSDLGMHGLNGMASSDTLKPSLSTPSSRTPPQMTHDDLPPSDDSIQPQAQEDLVVIRRLQWRRILFDILSQCLHVYDQLTHLLYSIYTTEARYPLFDTYTIPHLECLPAFHYSIIDSSPELYNRFVVMKRSQPWPYLSSFDFYYRQYRDYSDSIKLYHYGHSRQPIISNLSSSHHWNYETLTFSYPENSRFFSPYHRVVRYPIYPILHRKQYLSSVAYGQYRAYTIKYLQEEIRFFQIYIDLLSFIQRQRLPYRIYQQQVLFTKEHESWVRTTYRLRYPFSSPSLSTPFPLTINLVYILYQNQVMVFCLPQPPQPNLEDYLKFYESEWHKDIAAFTDEYNRFLALHHPHDHIDHPYHHQHAKLGQPLYEGFHKKMGEYIAQSYDHIIPDPLYCVALSLRLTDPIELQDIYPDLEDQLQIQHQITSHQFFYYLYPEHYRKHRYKSHANQHKYVYYCNHYIFIPKSSSAFLYPQHAPYFPLARTLALFDFFQNVIPHHAPLLNLLSFIQYLQHYRIIENQSSSETYTPFHDVGISRTVRDRLFYGAKLAESGKPSFTVLLALASMSIDFKRLLRFPTQFNKILQRHTHEVRDLIVSLLGLRQLTSHLFHRLLEYYGRSSRERHQSHFSALETEYARYALYSNHLLCHESDVVIRSLAAPPKPISLKMLKHTASAPPYALPLNSDKSTEQEIPSTDTLYIHQARDSKEFSITNSAHSSEDPALTTSNAQSSTMPPKLRELSFLLSQDVCERHFGLFWPNATPLDILPGSRDDEDQAYLEQIYEGATNMMNSLRQTLMTLNDEQAAHKVRRDAEVDRRTNERPSSPSLPFVNVPIITHPADKPVDASDYTVPLPAYNPRLNNQREVLHASPRFNPLFKYLRSYLFQFTRFMENLLHQFHVQYRQSEKDAASRLTNAAIKNYDMYSLIRPYDDDTFYSNCEDLPEVDFPSALTEYNIKSAQYMADLFCPFAGNWVQTLQISPNILGLDHGSCCPYHRQLMSFYHQQGETEMSYSRSPSEPDNCISLLSSESSLSPPPVSDNDSRDFSKQDASHLPHMSQSFTSSLCESYHRRQSGCATNGRHPFSFDENEPQPVATMVHHQLELKSSGISTNESTSQSSTSTQSREEMINSLASLCIESKSLYQQQQPNSSSRDPQPGAYMDDSCLPTRIQYPRSKYNPRQFYCNDDLAIDYRLSQPPPPRPMSLVIPAAGSPQRAPRAIPSLPLHATVSPCPNVSSTALLQYVAHYVREYRKPTKVRIQQEEPLTKLPNAQLWYSPNSDATPSSHPQPPNDTTDQDHMVYIDDYRSHSFAYHHHRKCVNKYLENRLVTITTQIKSLQDRLECYFEDYQDHHDSRHTDTISPQEYIDYLSSETELLCKEREEIIQRLIEYKQATAKVPPPNPKQPSVRNVTQVPPLNTQIIDDLSLSYLAHTTTKSAQSTNASPPLPSTADDSSFPFLFHQSVYELDAIYLYRRSPSPMSATDDRHISKSFTNEPLLKRASQRSPNNSRWENRQIIALYEEIISDGTVLESSHHQLLAEYTGLASTEQICANRSMIRLLSKIAAQFISIKPAEMHPYIYYSTCMVPSWSTDPRTWWTFVYRSVQFSSYKYHFRRMQMKPWLSLYYSSLFSLVRLTVASDELRRQQQIPHPGMVPYGEKTLEQLRCDVYDDEFQQSFTSSVSSHLPLPFMTQNQNFLNNIWHYDQNHRRYHRIIHQYAPVIHFINTHRRFLLEHGGVLPQNNTFAFSSSTHTLVRQQPSAFHSRYGFNLGHLSLADFHAMLSLRPAYSYYLKHPLSIVSSPIRTSLPSLPMPSLISRMDPLTVPLPHLVFWVDLLTQYIDPTSSDMNHPLNTVINLQQAFSALDRVSLHDLFLILKQLYRSIYQRISQSILLYANVVYYNELDNPYVAYTFDTPLPEYEHRRVDSIQRQYHNALYRYMTFLYLHDDASKLSSTTTFPNMRITPLGLYRQMGRHCPMPYHIPYKSSSSLAKMSYHSFKPALCTQQHLPINPEGLHPGSTDRVEKIIASEKRPLGQPGYRQPSIQDNNTNPAFVGLQSRDPHFALPSGKPDDAPIPEINNNIDAPYGVFGSNIDLHSHFAQRHLLTSSSQITFELQYFEQLYAFSTLQQLVHSFGFTIPHHYTGCRLLQPGDIVNLVDYYTKLARYSTHGASEADLPERLFQNAYSPVSQQSQQQNVSFPTIFDASSFLATYTLLPSQQYTYKLVKPPSGVIPGVPWTPRRLQTFLNSVRGPASRNLSTMYDFNTNLFDHVQLHSRQYIARDYSVQQTRVPITAEISLTLTDHHHVVSDSKPSRTSTSSPQNPDATTLPGGGGRKNTSTLNTTPRDGNCLTTTDQTQYLSLTRMHTDPYFRSENHNTSYISVHNYLSLHMQLVSWIHLHTMMNTPIDIQFNLRPSS